jgi:hypothetical protein
MDLFFFKSFITTDFQLEAGKWRIWRACHLVDGFISTVKNTYSYRCLYHRKFGFYSSKNRCSTCWCPPRILHPFWTCSHQPGRFSTCQQYIGWYMNFNLTSKGIKSANPFWKSILNGILTYNILFLIFTRDQIRHPLWTIDWMGF